MRPRGRRKRCLAGRNDEASGPPRPGRSHGRSARAALRAVSRECRDTRHFDPVGVKTYFSPNGDGQEDTATVYYCLAEAANVTITVEDSSGHVVRTLEDGVSHSGGSYCYSNNWVIWDGKSDSGSVVPDGVYTVQLHAVDAYGQTADASVQLGVDTRTPGALTKPSPGDTLSGSADWSFAPTSGFPVSTVSVYCQSGNSYSSASSPGSDGSFSGSLDTTGCPDGSNGIVAVASWTDPFGVAHSWAAPTVSVTINNAASTPPQLSIPSWVRRISAPTGTGRRTPRRSTSACRRTRTSTVTAKVDATVVDASGATVRTLESGTSTSGGPERLLTHSNWVVWDGKSDSGSVVPDGVYTVQLHAVDAYGQTADASVQLGVDTRTPGALTKPSPGDALSGSADWSFAPTSGFPVSTVYVYCPSGNSSSSASSPGSDGSFSGSLDTTGCPDGSNGIVAVASWTDPFGVTHSWSRADRLGHGQQRREYASAVVDPVVGKTYFSPNGDGQEDTATVYFCLSKNANVA